MPFNCKRSGPVYLPAFIATYLIFVSSFSNCIRPPHLTLMISTMIASFGRVGTVPWRKEELRNPRYGNGFGVSGKHSRNGDWVFVGSVRADDV